MFMVIMVMTGLKVIPKVKDKFAARQETAPCLSDQIDGYSEMRLNVVDT